MTACEVWGILNVTPDSFSDGGEHFGTDVAVAAALKMVSEGASVIDVGGESTRPGATRVSVEEELRRVIPVIEELAEQRIRVSCDTMRAEVARAAISAGACYINDVSGGKADPEILTVVADSDVDYVLMHWRGHSHEMDQLADYGNVVEDVISELQTSVAQAQASGISRHRIIVDPGFGFAKDYEHNWSLVRSTDRLVGEFERVLMGVSRKRMLQHCIPANAEHHDTAARDAATAALSFYFAQHGVEAVRVHHVPDSVAAIKTASMVGNA